jgi:hypothetical protein
MARAASRQRGFAPSSRHFIDKVFKPNGDQTMMRNLRTSLLIASIVIVWATTSEACHWRRGYYGAATYGYSGYASPGYGYSAPAGYYGYGGGYGMTSGGYYGGGYPGGYGYGYGRTGYNPGGLGGPYSGLGVRPGLGFGGFGPGR